MSWARAGTWIVAFIVGIVYGVAGTIGHSFLWGWFPLGLLVATVGVAALLIAVRLLTSDRWAALATGMGVMIATLVFSGSGPGGSIVVPAPPAGEINAGIIWTIAVPLIVAVVVAWPTPTKPRAEAMPADLSATTN